MKRDAIANPPSSSSQSTSRPDANRNKSAGSSGPAFTKGNEDLKSFPAPNNPYSK